MADGPGTPIRIVSSLIPGTIASRNNDGTVNIMIEGYPPDTQMVAEAIMVYKLVTDTTSPSLGVTIRKFACMEHGLNFDPDCVDCINVKKENINADAKSTSVTGTPASGASNDENQG